MRDKNSAVTKFVLQFEPYFQGNLHECPFEIGPIRIYNYTDTHHQEMDELDRKGVELPDGFFNFNFRGDVRLKVNLWTFDDDNVFNITLVYVVNYRKADRF